MDDRLKKIIESSEFVVHDGEFVYAKLSSLPSSDDYFMISRDEDEITAVFDKEKRDSFQIIEENKDIRKLIQLKVSTPFYATGFLAAATGAISSKGCNNLIISTYSKDYVLVTIDQFEQAKQALLELGMKEEVSSE